MRIIDRLRTGNFNDMIQEWQDDGSVRVTLTKRGDSRQYVMFVKDLYGKEEEVISEEIIERNGYEVDS